ncbi:MAG: hypothetical protein ORN54_10405 [Cyclobacteriaceae bacterium]|nr:hypothetical protein [Cyclobacteriaceae bacterium]
MKVLFIITMLLIVEKQVFAQTPTTINNNVRSANLLNQLGSYRVTPGDVFFPISSNEKSQTIGDVYLDAHWSKSSVLLFDDERLISDYLTRYDIQNNEFEFRLKGGIKVLAGVKVKNIVWIDSLTKQSRVMNNAREYNASVTLIDGFFEVLQDGDIQLLKKVYLEILRPNFSPALNVGSKDTKIIKKSEYFYAIKNKLNQIKKKTSLDPIRQYDTTIDLESLLKKERINLNQESDLRRLFLILNSKK